MEERIKQLEAKVKSLEEKGEVVFEALIRIDQTIDSQVNVLTNLYEATKALAERLGVKV